MKQLITTVSGKHHSGHSPQPGPIGGTEAEAQPQKDVCVFDDSKREGCVLIIVHSEIKHKT